MARSGKVQAAERGLSSAVRYPKRESHAWAVLQNATRELWLELLAKK